MSNYIEDDECDSSFFHRLHKPAISPLDLEPLQSVKIEPTSTDKVLVHQPINKSLNSSDFDDLSSSIDTSLDNKQQSWSATTTADNDNDLTDLNWLSTYDISKCVKLERLDIKSDTTSNDESDHDYSYLNLFQKTPFFNKLFTHSRPPYSYSFLTYTAIESKATKCASLKEIYSWFTLNFPYYRSIPSTTWKNEVKQNLLCNQYFAKIDTPNQSRSVVASLAGGGHQRNKRYANVNVWRVKSEYRDTLNRIIKETPHKASCMLQDVSDCMNTTSKRSLHNYVQSKQSVDGNKQGNNGTTSANENKETTLTAFYKKACNEPKTTCSDIDAASALLMIKSAIKTESSPRRRKMQKPMRNPRASINDNKSGSKSRKRKLKVKITPAIKKNIASDPTEQRQTALTQLTSKSDLTMSLNKLTIDKSSKGTRKNSTNRDDNDHSDSAESYDFGDSDDDSSLSYGESSMSDQATHENPDNLRNTLLELSRAAQIIEDKQQKPTRASK